MVHVACGDTSRKQSDAVPAQDPATHTGTARKTLTCLVPHDTQQHFAIIIDWRLEFFKWGLDRVYLYQYIRSIRVWIAFHGHH